MKELKTVSAIYNKEAITEPDESSLAWFNEQRLMPYLLGALCGASLEYKKMSLFRTIKANEQFKQLVEISVVLKAHDVDYRLLKGFGVATTYPKLFMRSMGDYDILVKPEAVKVAISTLGEIGYQAKGREQIKDWILEKENAMKIELHFALFEALRISEGDLLAEEMWSSASQFEYDGHVIKVPSPEVHFKYLILHTLHHFKGSGIGIRFLLDLAYFSEHHCLDYNAYLTYFDELNYGKYYRCLISTMIYILEKPLEDFSAILPKDDPVLVDFMAFMCSDGLFNDASEASITNAMYTSFLRPYRIKNKFKMYRVLLLPMPKELSNQYYYAKKNKVLLPIAWVHRFLRYFYRNDLSRKQKTFFMSKDVKAVGKRDELMKALGFYEG